MTLYFVALLITVKFLIQTLARQIKFMKYWNSYETYWDTYIDKYFAEAEWLLIPFFEHKYYGPEVEELRTIINCSPGHQFKQRSKFRRKEKLLFFDIVIDYDAYMNLINKNEKKRHLAGKFISDMNILSKFKPKDFDLLKMRKDFSIFFRQIEWLP